MLDFSHRMTGLITGFILCLCYATSAFAFSWSLHFAPLNRTANDAEAYAPSSTVPVTPQFFRIVVARKQVVLGAEDPYIRIIGPAPPIRFQQTPARPVPAPATQTRASMPMRQRLRGPEAFLLRHTETIAGKTPQ